MKVTMWFKEYKDYPIDTDLIQNKVHSGKGIIGAEMHELNGWGHSYTPPKKRKPGFISRILKSFSHE